MFFLDDPDYHCLNSTECRALWLSANSSAEHKTPPLPFVLTWESTDMAGQDKHTTGATAVLHCNLCVFVYACVNAHACFVLIEDLFATLCH